MVKRIVKIMAPALAGLLILSCGKTSVTIDEHTYEPKIAINGLLYPGQPVSKIKITRNFPIGQTIEKDKIALAGADVWITALPQEKLYKLSFNIDSGYFEYLNDDLIIDYERSYRLDVQATIDDQHLSATSVTTVPGRGLEILPNLSVYGDLYYRQPDPASGRLITPVVAYNQSPKSAFYLLSISALTANFDNFIYENPLKQDLREMVDNGARIESFQYRARWTRPREMKDCACSIEVNWFAIWFYSRYRLVLYAADDNFYHYYMTHRNVMDMDGNLHEPVFDIEGDGIGVFGSAVTDTVYLNILKN